MDVSFLIARLTDPQFMMMLLSGIAAAATVLSIGIPLLERNDLSRRMRAVSVERDRIRARERERLNKEQKVTLRQEPKAYMKRIVDQFRLGDWLGTERAKLMLTRAGYRGPQAEIGFLFFRLIVPGLLAVATVFYVFVLGKVEQPLAIRLGIVVAALYAGIKLPELYLTNTIKKRQQSMRRAWPDAMDLLLICVESGMSIEAAFRRGSGEMTAQSTALAEELTLTTAELSYLSERRTAYENLANRTDLESVKGVCTALIQAERYGTPVGQALRVLSQESRDMRMNEAEKKAAALPPKLTVPMIVFFLPVLFVVLMTPALIQVFKWQ